MGHCERELLDKLLHHHDERFAYINVTSAYALSSNGTLRLKVPVTVRRTNISNFLAVEVRSVTMVSENGTTCYLATLSIKNINRESSLVLMLHVEPRGIASIVGVAAERFYMSGGDACMVAINPLNEIRVLVKLRVG